MKLDPIEIYDVGVIGGGICGAAIARDASLRGLRVALFEKASFASGTSSKSSKLIHGGVRYLELAWRALRRGDQREAWKNLRFVFVSLRESRILRRIAPELVRPLRLFVPIYRSDKRRAWTIYCGAVFYSLLALFSGRAVLPRIYAGQNAALTALPELERFGLIGAVEISDHQVDDKALVLATLESAKKNGALCLENAPVTQYEHDVQTNTYLITFMEEGQERLMRVRKLVNAGGPWVDKIKNLGKEKERDYLLPVAGSHLTLEPFLQRSVLLQAEDGRFFFVINHQGKARVGTTERLVTNVDGVKPTEEEVNYLLAALNRYFPGREFSKKDIVAQDAGVRPLPAPSSSRNPNDIPREHEIRVSRSGCVHMLGVKLTDHRRAAESVVDRLVPGLMSFNPRARRKTLTHRVPLTA